MPCWEVRETSVKLQAADWTLLGTALRAEYGDNKVIASRDDYAVDLGSSWVRVTRDSISGNEYAVQENANRIKRAYSREVVKSTAQRFNWRLQETSPGRFVAQKRG